MRFGLPQVVFPVDAFGDLKKNDFILGMNKIGHLEKINALRVGDQTGLQTNNDGLRGITEEQTHEVVQLIQSSKAEEKVTRVQTKPSSYTSKDVLLEKGGCRQKHPANAFLSELVEMKRSAYQNASKFEKTCISMSIVKLVKEADGRFLKRRDRCSNDWVEICDKEARKAISHRLRNEAPRRLKSEKQRSEKPFTLDALDSPNEAVAASRKRAKK